MYSVWNFLWFQSPTEGLGMYPLQIREDYWTAYNGIQCITLVKINYVQSLLFKSIKQKLKQYRN